MLFLSYHALFHFDTPTLGTMPLLLRAHIPSGPSGQLTLIILPKLRASSVFPRPFNARNPSTPPTPSLSSTSSHCPHHFRHLNCVCLFCLPPLDIPVLPLPPPFSPLHGTHSSNLSHSTASTIRYCRQALLNCTHPQYRPTQSYPIVPYQVHS